MKASEFLAEFFEPRSRELVYICSFANDGNSRPQHLYTRDFSTVDVFIETWDKPGRGLYFGCATVSGDRRKDNVAEIVCLHTDLDFKGIKASREEIEEVLAHLRLKPSRVVFSGHGLHVYWFFQTACTDIPRVERSLKRLAWALAGDKQAAETARVMRLPSSHNTKFDEWTEAVVTVRNDVAYSLEELEAWLDAMPRPLLPAIEKTVQAKPPGAPKSGFERVADRYHDRLDLDAMWDGMEYYGVGAGGNLHETVIRIGAALLSRGEPVESAIIYLREQLLARVAESASWDWTQEIHAIQGQCVSWFVKHPELLAKQQNKPDWLVQDSRIRSLVGGKKPGPRVKLDEATRAMLAGGPIDNVVRLKTEPKAEAESEEVVELTYITAEELETWPVEDVEWIVPGFIMRNVVNGLFGDGGVGKDYLQLQLAIAMSCETTWLGREVSPGKVLYFNVEDQLKRLRWRQDRINRFHGVTAKAHPDRLRIVSMLGKKTIIAAFDSKSGVVEPTPVYRAMEKMIMDFRPDMVIVGNRVNIFSVNQNDDSQARQCIELLNAFTVDYETTVLMPGHVSVRGGVDTSGSSGSGSSGTVQWSNGLRNRLVLSKVKLDKEDEALGPVDNNKRVLEVVKVNDAPTGAKLELHWHAAGLFAGVDESVKEVKTSAELSTEERDQDIRREFLKMLDKNTMKKVPVSPSTTARNNAAYLFSLDPDCKYRGKRYRGDLRKAMDSLFADGMIKSVDTGPPSNPRPKLERVGLHVVKNTSDDE